MLSRCAMAEGVRVAMPTDVCSDVCVRKVVAYVILAYIGVVAYTFMACIVTVAHVIMARMAHNDVFLHICNYMCIYAIICTYM